jgi:hypothetical protein
VPGCRRSFQHLQCAPPESEAGPRAEPPRHMTAGRPTRYSISVRIGIRGPVRSRDLTSLSADEHWRYSRRRPAGGSARPRPGRIVIRLAKEDGQTPPGTCRGARCEPGLSPCHQGKSPRRQRTVPADLPGGSRSRVLLSASRTGTCPAEGQKLLPRLTCLKV